MFLGTQASNDVEGNLGILYLLELHGAWVRQEINERCSPRAEEDLINPDDTSNGFLEELIGTLELFMILFVNDDRWVSDRWQWARGQRAVTRNHRGKNGAGSKGQEVKVWGKGERAGVGGSGATALRSGAPTDEEAGTLRRGGDAEGRSE